MAGIQLKIPPVVILAVAATTMWLAARTTSNLAFTLPANRWIAAIIALAGAIVAAWGVGDFRRARTTVHPLRPQDASALVTDGVYRFTRNPMYLGMLWLLVAWAVFLAHPLAFAVLPGFVLYLNRFQIAREEAALTRLFGEPFAAYCRNVRRWL